MTREQWRHAKVFLVEAIGLDAAEQERLVQQHCPSDAILQKELLELLRCHTLATVRLPVLSTVGSNSEETRDDVPQRDAPPLFQRSDAPVFEPGDMCGRYRIIRSLGAGGMGEVYLAEDTELRTPIALKVLCDVWLESPEGRTHLRREARRAAELRGHPHIATLHDIVEVVDVRGRRVPVMVMEYVEGAAASAIVADGPVRVARAVRWAIEIASAIEYAHDRGVLHCDLKPSNVQITRDDHAKVLDFGIARTIFERGEGKGPVAGTPAYMAPEQLVEGQFTEAGDLYSLGVTLYELVTARRPFEAPTSNELLLEVIGGVPPKASTFVPNLPARLDEILDRALAKVPRQRYQSAGEFKRELRTVLEEETKPKASGRMTAIAMIVSLTAALVGIVGLGALTTAVFNIKLGRSDFVNDTFWDWLIWGRRTSVGPFVILLAILLPAIVVQRTWRLLKTISFQLRRLDESVRHYLLTQRRRFQLDDVGVLSSCAVLVSLAALGLAVFTCRELLIPLAAFASTGSNHDLALLSPSFVTYHNQYRGIFTLAVIVSVAVWYPVARLVWNGQAPHWPTAATGAVVMIAALVFLHFPYRTLFSPYVGELFEVVKWNQQDCYVIGQRADNVLLLCPDLEAPRHRIVKGNDVAPLGIRESPFSRFRR